MQKLRNTSDVVLNDIVQYNEKLCKYNWGFVHKGKILSDTESDMFELYRTISPERFHQYEIGVCWDYVSAEAEWFLDIGFDITMNELRDETFSQYYIEYQDGEKNPTHTWISFQYNENVYIFEASWKKYVGIWRFDSEKSMVKTYSSLWMKNGQYQHGTVYKYPQFKHYNLIPEDFMLSIKVNGNKILEI